MAKKREIVPGVTANDVRKITDQVFDRTDENHPQLNLSGNGFIDILQKGKPDISASSVFIKKASL